SPSTRNTSPLMVSMPRSFPSSHFKRLGCPPILSGQGPILILACAALDRLRHSTALHEMMPMILAMDTMAASSVSGTWKYVFYRPVRVYRNHGPAKPSQQCMVISWHAFMSFVSDFQKFSDDNLHSAFVLLLRLWLLSPSLDRNLIGQPIIVL